MTSRSLVLRLDHYAVLRNSLLKVKSVPVKIGISDDNYWEITDGLKEGDEIVTGGYHAISRDLDDGKKITKGATNSVADKAKS